MKDFYCECGQFLTTYFRMLGKCHPGKTIEMCGVPCPAKDCEKTYTVKITADNSIDESMPDEIRLSEKNARIIMEALDFCYSEGLGGEGDDSELLAWIADHYPQLKEDFSYLP